MNKQTEVDRLAELRAQIAKAKAEAEAEIQSNHLEMVEASRKASQREGQIGYLAARKERFGVLWQEIADYQKDILDRTGGRLDVQVLFDLLTITLLHCATGIIPYKSFVDWFTFYGEINSLPKVKGKGK